MDVSPNLAPASTFVAEVTEKIAGRSQKATWADAYGTKPTAKRKPKTDKDLDRRCSVRLAALKDINAIYRFITELALEEGYAPSEIQLTKDNLKSAIFGLDPLAYAYIADYQGTPVGFAVCYRTFSTMLARPGLHLDDLYIAPQYRGMGLGKALLELIQIDADHKKCARLEWWVLESNTAAQNFYRKLGANRVPEVQVFRMTNRNPPTGTESKG